MGVVPQLACDMLLGRDWTQIYDTLGRVQDAEAEWRKIRNHEGWLGELEEEERSDNKADKVDLCNIASSLQFQEAQEEDHELQTLRMQAYNARDSLTSVPIRAPWFEVKNQLWYHVQQGRMGEPEGTQLVFSTWFCQVIWWLAHSSPIGGHLG